MSGSGRKRASAGRIRKRDRSDPRFLSVTHWLDSHSIWAIAIVVGIVVLIRGYYLSRLHGNPFFSDPILDSRLYDSWAMQIVRGDWLGRDPFFMTPLYPYFLAFIYLLVGHNQLTAVAAQLLVGTGSCVLVFLIARRLARIHVAITASLILAFYGPLLFFEGLLLPEFLGIFTNLAWLYTLIRTEHNTRPSAFFVAGVFLGLSVLVRASAIVFFLAIFLWLASFSSVRLRTTWLCFGALALGAFLMIAPVTVRNYITGKDLVFVTSNGGLNFYIGNGDDAEGLYKPIKELQMVGGDTESDWSGRYYAEENVGRKLKPSEVSAFWMRKALLSVESHPGRFVVLNLKKILLFWNSYEFPQIEDYYVWRNLFPSRIPLVSFVFVGPLGVVGLILASKKTGKFFLLRMFVFCYMLSISVFFITARYRVQIVPVLSIFSAYFLWWCVEHIVRKSYTNLAGGLALLVLIAAATGKPTLGAMGIRPSSDSWYSHFYTGTKLLANPGTIDRAIVELDRAVQLNPRNPEAFNNLGLAYQRKGMLAEATSAFERALGADSTYAEAWYNLAFLRQTLEDYSGATHLYLRVLKLQPYLPRAHFNLGICFLRQGRLSEAADQLRAVIQLEPANAEAHNQLGIILGEQGNTDEAIEQFKEALVDKPDYEGARRNLEMLVQFKSGQHK